jgi:hypothetical protein
MWCHTKRWLAERRYELHLRCKDEVCLAAPDYLAMKKGLNINARSGGSKV